MTFASQEKVAPVNEKTGVELEQAHKDVTCDNANRLLPEEDNPQLDFLRNHHILMNGLQKRQLDVTILVICSLEQQTVNISGSSYHKLVRIETNVTYERLSDL